MSVQITPPSYSVPFSQQAFRRLRDKSLPPLRLALHNLAANPSDLPPQVSGLRTPPVDNMATAYHHHLGANAYEKHGLPNGHSTLAPQSHLTAVSDPRSASHYRNSAHVTAPPASQHQLQPQPPVLASNRNSQQQNAAIHPASPVFKDPSQLKEVKAGGGAESETLIHHSLQIPKCISLHGGSISEFATRMTCLFWFETAEELQNAKKIKSRPASSTVPPLPELAKPHESFSKWTYGVLSTTQVTQNVILLALLFIYRLKLSTPRIKGRAGSEYRLLTVALMLSNKFLDDNTYTNKTWAEVSGFAVQEIHVMEVEFLNNLRYNLLVSAHEWEEWLANLACFHEYYGRALVLPHAQSPPAVLPSPTHTGFYSPHHAVTPVPFPDTTALYASAHRLSPKAALQQPSGPNFIHNSVSPTGLRNDLEYLAPPRKRSLEQDMCEQHIAKRSAPNRRPHTEHTKLAVPQLSVVTTHLMTPQAPVVPDMISLPPLQPGMRAMSTVYPQQQQQQQQQQMALMGVSQPAISTPISLATPASSVCPVSSLPHQNTAVGYRTPSKHHSPTNLAPAYASSPLGDLVTNSTANTPMGQTPFFNSPMTYLEQRHSPYRPIRHVHHLGQATSLDHYHLAVPVQPAQMHYQALGRRDEVRSGVVPEFLLYNRQPMQQAGPLRTPGYFQGGYGT